jgi:hypothetical protein
MLETEVELPSVFTQRKRTYESHQSGPWPIKIMMADAVLYFVL